jgi:hypothetical protein
MTLLLCHGVSEEESVVVVVGDHREGPASLVLVRRRVNSGPILARADGGVARRVGVYVDPARTKQDANA